MYRGEVSDILTMLNVGVNQVLGDAADILEVRGLNRGSVIHPFTGEVDIWGALCLAAGAREQDLDDHPDLIDDSVPQPSRGLVEVAYRAVSLMVGDDASNWGDQHSQAEVVEVLRHLSTRTWTS